MILVERDFITVDIFLLRVFSELRASQVSIGLNFLPCSVVGPYKVTSLFPICWKAKCFILFFYLFFVCAGVSGFKSNMAVAVVTSRVHACVLSRGCSRDITACYLKAYTFFFDRAKYSRICKLCNLFSNDLKAKLELHLSSTDKT